MMSHLWSTAENHQYEIYLEKLIQISEEDQT